VQLIGVKPALGRLQEVCYRKTGYSRLSPPANADAEHCGFTKRSFTVGKGQLESVAADFRSYNLNTMRHYRPSGGGALRHRLWICKPRGGFNSVGIHMHSLPTEELSSEDATLAWLTRRVPAGEYVMQDFEMNPMTFAGHKFDLRVWAVVLSLDPLRTPRCPRHGPACPCVPVLPLSPVASRGSAFEAGLC